MSGNKTQTSTSQQTSTPVNQAALQNIYNTVQGAASTPYTPYSGELTAGINGQQTAGINTINNSANSAQPYYSQAAGLASGAANPLTSAQIQQYQNPYTQDVVNATQAQFNDINGQQQNSLKGTAAQQGALGGDRQAVAQAQLAGQQQLSQAPVIAGLYSNSYNTGLNTAAQQFQQNPLAASSAISGIGSNVENAGLAGGAAQLAAGTQQQQTSQAADTANYNQYLAQQANPYQNAAFLEQYGLPSALGQGSTSNGTQTTPGPNTAAQIAGLGIAGAGLFLKDGGRVGYYSGGAPGYVDSGAGYVDSNAGYIPQGRASQNTLQAPQLQFAKQQTSTANPFQSSISGLNGMKGDFSGAAYGGGNALTDSYGGSSSNPLPGLDASDYGAGYKIGGLVEAIHHIHRTIKRSRGGAVGSMPFQTFADGGDTTFDDRFSAAYDNPLLQQPAPQQPDPEIINPNDPVRLDPQATQAWRDGVDQPNPAIVADSGMPDADGTAPNPMIAPQSAPQGLPPQITNPDNASEQPSSALAFDSSNPMQTPMGANGLPTVVAPAHSAPEQQFGHSLFGANISDKTRQALVAGGLGIMASRSPFALTALGEGGLQGLKSYSESGKAEQEAQDKAVSQANEQQRINLQAKQIAQNAAQFAKTNARADRALDEKGDMTDYQKAEVDRQKRDEALKLKTPIKIGESVSGAPIMALPKLNPKTNEVDLYPIGRDGSIANEPVAPGSNIRGQPTQAAPTNVPPRDPTAPVGSPQSRNQSYIGQIQQEDPAYAASIKKAADYELDPAKYASMRTNQRQKFINDVIQYDPNYNPQEVGLKYRAQAAFLPGTKNGDTITAFNTAISHLDTLKQMYVALKNGDVQAFNHLKNTFQQQFGYAAPNDVAALSSIIGGEVVKATVGSQNALGDREEVRQSIGRDLSSQQADSVIDKYQKLMAGQLNARKFAYEQSTGLHNFEDKFLLPRSQQVLHSVGNENQSGFTPPAGAIPRTANGKTYYYEPDTKQPYPGQ